MAETITDILHELVNGVDAVQDVDALIDHYAQKIKNYLDEEIERAESRAEMRGYWHGSDQLG